MLTAHYPGSFYLLQQVLFETIMYNVNAVNWFSRHAWDMAAEICLSQLPALLSDSNLEFQVL